VSRIHGRCRDFLAMESRWAFRVEKEGVCGHVLIRWGGSPGSKMQPLTFSQAQIMQVHFHLLPTVISGPFRPPLFRLPARFLNQSDLPLLYRVIAPNWFQAVPAYFTPSLPTVSSLLFSSSFSLHRFEKRSRSPLNALLHFHTFFYTTLSNSIARTLL
jgi:hypothetical protein